MAYASIISAAMKKFQEQSGGSLPTASVGPGGYTAPGGTPEPAPTPSTPSTTNQVTNRLVAPPPTGTNPYITTSMIPDPSNLGSQTSGTQLSGNPANIANLAGDMVTPGGDMPATPTPTLQELYPESYDVATATPGAVGTATQAQTQDAVAGQAGVGQAGATQAAAQPGATAAQVGTDVVTGGPTEMSAAQQLADITATDSRLMRQARQQGLLTAASRGLTGSSIAAGAAEAEMVRAATPLAQQDAATAVSIAQANQKARNTSNLATQQLETQVAMQSADINARIESLNAQMGTDVSKFNAAQISQAEALNAQMQTAVSQGNSAAYNAAQQQFADLQTRVNMADADRSFQASMQAATEENAMNRDMMAQITDLNKQFLAGTKAIDLATIQGQYQQLISTNETAASMYQSYFNSISGAMANKDLRPDRIADIVNINQNMLEAGLRFMDKLNNLELGEFELPGARGTTGKYGTLTPTEGTGFTAPVGTPAPATPGYPYGVPLGGWGMNFGY